MTATFPKARLGSLLRHRKEFFTLDDTARYKRVRIQLHNRGIVLRDIVEGSELRTKKQQAVKAGDLLVAEIDAKVGGFGIVPAELNGAIVSSHYFLYEIDETECLRGWLEAFIRAGGLEDQVKARGTTNYAAIRAEQVLEFEIPLPPLVEQRRIVARIDELATKIAEARSLRKQTEESCEALLRSILFYDGDARRSPMHRLVRLREPDVGVSPKGTYQFAGVYCFGRGIFQGAKREGVDFAYKSLTRLRAGDLVYPKLMAWEGAIAIVPPEAEGHVVSPEFPVFEVNQERVLPETLDIYFRSPSVWQELAEISTGTNVRRRRLHPSAFLSYEMPLPAMTTQLRLREVSRMMSDAKQLQAETAAELNDLLPSILDKAFKGELR